MTTTTRRTPFTTSLSADERKRQMAAHPWWGELVDNVDGWVDLTETAARIHGYTIPQPTLPNDDASLGAMIVDGRDPDEVAALKSQADGERHQAHSIDQLLRAAREQLNARAETWVDEHRVEIATALSDRLEGILAQARPLVQGPLAFVQTGDDLAGAPSAAPAFAKLVDMATRFATGSQLADMLADQSGQDRDPYPSLSLFAVYEEAYPKFFLSREPLQIRGVDVVPASHAPWMVTDRRGVWTLEDPLARIRYFAGTELPIAVASSAYELQRRRARLEQLASKRRQELTDKEMARA